MHKKFRTILGLSEDPTALVQLRPDLLTAVSAIAAQDGRSIGEVVNELLGHALYDYQMATHSLDIWQQLTPREREVTAWIWLGLTNFQIAQRLSISTNTVKTHVKNILAKFDVRSKKRLALLLANLDLSDWTDMGDGQPPPPTPADSPSGVNP